MLNYCALAVICNVESCALQLLFGVRVLNEGKKRRHAKDK